MFPGLQKDVLQQIGGILLVFEPGIQIVIDLHMIAVIERLKRWKDLLLLVRRRIRRHAVCPSLLFFSSIYTKVFRNGDTFLRRFFGAVFHQSAKSDKWA
jgi:hypothetical protein